MRYSTKMYEQQKHSSSTLCTLGSNNSLSSLATTMSSSSNSNSHEQKQRKRRMPKRSVSFAVEEKIVYEVDCFKDMYAQVKDEIWYDGREMHNSRKNDIKALKKAQQKAGTKAFIETDDMTWRGFEDIQYGFCRVQKSALYTNAVVEEYCNQIFGGYSDPDEIRSIAKGLSKEERSRARKAGIEDAKKAGITTKKSSSTKSSNGKKSVGSSFKSWLNKKSTSTVALKSLLVVKPISS